jgi:hypothetical protein
VISATENSNKFQETRFGKEESVEDMVTLGPAVLCMNKFFFLYIHKNTNFITKSGLDFNAIIKRMI